MEDRRSRCGDPVTIADTIAGVARAHHLDAEQCEEWTQIAWLKVLGSTDLLSKQFRGEASFRTYLGTVLNNRCLDWLAHRTRSQQQAVPVDDVRMALERASARARSRSTPPPTRVVFAQRLFATLVSPTTSPGRWFGPVQDSVQLHPQDTNPTVPV